MIEAVLDIKQWGKSLGVRLPATVARAAHLYVDQRVRISVEDRAIVIRPVEDDEPTRHGGEAMPGQAVGVERW